MNRVRNLALGAWLVAASWHAHGQTNDAASTAAKARPEPVPAATESVEKSAEPAAPINADNLTDDTRKRLTKGYTRVPKDEVSYYCRIEKPIGSRLGKRQCYTIEQLIDMERIRVQTQKRWERKQYERPTNET